MLGKNLTSVQNVIMLAQKKDVELCIIKGLHNHDPGHKVNNIASKQINNKTALNPAMLRAAHTWYEIAMNQYVINPYQT